ncbi:MFS general substrate transporter [Xylariaceae sp. FL0016]|nr:MFS general substrate transporter [Xylariaceae sp. FL0016]
MMDAPIVAGMKGLEAGDSRDTVDARNPVDGYASGLESCDQESPDSPIEAGDTRDDVQTDSNDRGPHEDGSKQRDGLSRADTNMSIAETLPLPREIVFVAVICLAQLFTQAGLGNTISVIRIIGANFGTTSAGELSWLIAGYSLTVGTFILFSGRLGDVFGYKPMFLIGMGWFSVWSLVCGLAAYSNHVLFVFARVLQGIGPAIVLPNGLAILGATYAPGRRKEMIFAIFGATAPGGSVLGSVFSGVFALTWWPWAFWAFSIILATVTVVGVYAIPPCPAKFRRDIPRGFKETMQQLDMIGTILGVTGLVLFNFSWNQAPIVGWQRPYVFVLLIIGALFLAGFFVYETHYAKHPLIPFHALSRDVSFVLGAVACGWSSFGIWFFYTWQFLLVLRQEPPLLATAMFVPVAVSGACAAIFTGFMISRLGSPVIMTCALVAFTVGHILVATTPVNQTYWAQTFVSMIVMPWGMDMSFPAGTLILSDSVPREHQGIAASLVNTVVNYSISLGLGFAGTVEIHVNNGGRTPADLLRGYHGAFYMAVGLAGLGILVCVSFLVRTHQKVKATEQPQEKA